MPEPFLVQAEGTLPIQHFSPADQPRAGPLDSGRRDPPRRSGCGPSYPSFTWRVARTAKNKQKVFLAAYTPGDVPSIFPPGVAKKISRGSDLTFEVHYTPIGEVRFDRFSVGLIRSQQPPRHQAITKGIPQHELRIPPGAKDHVERSAWTLRSDIQILSFMPHMHLRGKSFTYTAQYPDGRTEILLSVPNYDFNWQSAYRLAEPKPVPRGTTIHCEARYDNSADNPANPDPNREVTWGEQTWDEMLIRFIWTFFKGRADRYHRGVLSPAGPDETERVGC